MISPFFGFGFGSPFYPYPVFPYYPEPIYSEPVYVNPPYNDPVNQAMSAQIEQAPPTPSSGEASQVPVVVVLKDGRRIEAQGYALVGSTLWILSSHDATKIPLHDVETDGTRRANLERGIDVVIPVLSNG